MVVKYVLHHLYSKIFFLKNSKIIYLYFIFLNYILYTVGVVGCAEPGEAKAGFPATLKQILLSFSSL